MGLLHMVLDPSRSRVAPYPPYQQRLIFPLTCQWTQVPQVSSLQRHLLVQAGDGGRIDEYSTTLHKNSRQKKNLTGISLARSLAPWARAGKWTRGGGGMRCFPYMQSCRPAWF